MEKSSTYLLTVPVADVLSHFGRRADHRGYMYWSPFRDEREPSMRVTVDPSDGTWVWADFGGTPPPGRSVDGGGVLDMVRRLSGAATDSEAMEVLRGIAAGGGVSCAARPRPAVPSPRGEGVRVVSVSRSFRPGLLSYALRDRRIPLSLLSRYCRQVSYRPSGAQGRTFSAIGFPNDSGGWALRGSARGRKLNTAWGMSTLGYDGLPLGDRSSTSDTVALFEGFMDFLAWLAWRGVVAPGVDVCVLNSASNAAHARPLVESHAKVRTFFDRDPAGDRATDLVRSWCPEGGGRDFRDARPGYAGSKDLAEAWAAAAAARETRGRRP